MHFSILAALVLPLIASAAPTPAPATDAATAKSPEFRLKTKLLRGAPARFANLYAQGYHIGAGENDIVLVSNATAASHFYFNGTSLDADLGTSFDWTVIMSEATTYAGKSRTHSSFCHNFD